LPCVCGLFNFLKEKCGESVIEKGFIKDYRILYSIWDFNRRVIMSWETYQKVIELIQQNEEECDFVGERTEELINKAEKVLGIRFSKIYRDFVMKFGAGSFGSEEIYGVIHEDFENSSVPDAIWFTLSERKESNLPNHLLVIYDTGMGELFCLNFKNENKEPNVVMYNQGVEIDEQEFTQIANDFGDFPLNLIQEGSSL
jgi:antitoxin YobK